MSIIELEGAIGEGSLTAAEPGSKEGKHSTTPTSADEIMPALLDEITPAVTEAITLTTADETAPDVPATSAKATDTEKVADSVVGGTILDIWEALLD